MGNIFTCQLTCETLIARCWDCTAAKATYVCQLEDNLEDLQTETQKLTELKNDVMNRVEIGEEAPQMKRLEQVEGWRLRVENSISEVVELRAQGPQEIKKLCLGGCCSKNYKSSYDFGKKVAKRLKNVRDQKNEGENFKNEVVEKRPTKTVVERPVEPTVGLEAMLNEVWSCLEKEQYEMIGLYGMGGVGKTTLLTQINNKFLQTPKSNDFDVVIWVVVSKDLRLEKVQEDIGKQIGFSDEQWKNKSLDEKAVDILNVLSKKKFVLLLDDLWERFNLTQIGVPSSERQSRSKIVITTRSEEVCGQMGAQKRFKVQTLTEAKAWELFQNRVGEEALNIHPEIRSLAMTVAKECGGLPLALITIGRAMACKRTPQEWRRAIEILKNYASQMQVIKDEVFPPLKFSYDSLPDQRVRSCFLYCSLFPEDFKIHKDTLIEYWICENFWGDYDNRASAYDEGHDIIGTFVYACLLEDGGEYVKMHDMLRDMALWIACESEKATENFLVKADARLIEAPEAEKWKGVRRISLMGNSFKELTKVPTCPDLLTLFLRDNHKLHMIIDGFFQFMGALTVLDLSNSGIKKLPKGISKLVSLQYLNLSSTNIEELPVELQALLKLKYLNLDQTRQLTICSRKVISSLLSLQVLKMLYCLVSYKAEGEGEESDDDSEMLIKELQCLEHLNALRLTISSLNGLQRLVDDEKLLSCTQVLHIESFHGTEALCFSPLANMRQLDKLHIHGFGDLEELVVTPIISVERRLSLGGLYNSEISREIFFNTLREVHVERCRKLQDLTWLVLVPNLTVLKVSDCDEMVEMFAIRKLKQVWDVHENLYPFAKLEVLELRDLPLLKIIYRYDGLPFPFLKRILVRYCKRLKKLPLDSNSAKGSTVVIEGEDWWWQALEWEDNATKTAFLPCFKSIFS